MRVFGALRMCSIEYDCQLEAILLELLMSD